MCLFLVGGIIFDNAAPGAYQLHITRTLYKTHLPHYSFKCLKELDFDHELYNILQRSRLKEIDIIAAHDLAQQGARRRNLMHARC